MCFLCLYHQLILTPTTYFLRRLNAIYKPEHIKYVRFCWFFSLFCESRPGGVTFYCFIFQQKRVQKFQKPRWRSGEKTLNKIIFWCVCLRWPKKPKWTKKKWLKHFKKNEFFGFLENRFFEVCGWVKLIWLTFDFNFESKTVFRRIKNYEIFKIIQNQKKKTKRPS